MYLVATKMSHTLRVMKDCQRTYMAAQRKAADAAIAAEETAKSSLPAGDPSIAELHNVAMAEVDKQIAIQNEILATLRA